MTDFAILILSILGGFFLGALLALWIMLRYETQKIKRIKEDAMRQELSEYHYQIKENQEVKKHIPNEGIFEFDADFIKKINKLLNN